MEDIKSIKIIIRGRVQGVGFRYHTKTFAEKLSLKGSVRNLPNGDVIVLASGKSAEIKKLLNYCSTGPSAAIVKEVRTDTPDEEESSFLEISHGFNISK